MVDSEEPEFSYLEFKRMRQELQDTKQELEKLKEDSKPENNCVVQAYNDICALYFNGDGNDPVLEDFLRERDYPQEMNPGDNGNPAVWKYFNALKKANKELGSLPDSVVLDRLNALMEGTADNLTGWTADYCKHVKANFEYFRDRDDEWLCINERTGNIRICRRGEHNGCCGYPKHREAALRSDGEEAEGQAQEEVHLF